MRRLRPFIHDLEEDLRATMLFVGKCNRNPCRFMHRELPPPNVYRRTSEQPNLLPKEQSIRSPSHGLKNSLALSDGSEVKTAQNSTNHVIKDPPRKRPNPGNSLASNSGGGGSEYECTLESSSSGTKAMNFEKIKPSSNSSVLVVEGNASEDKTAVSGIALPSRSDKLFSGSSDGTVHFLLMWLWPFCVWAWNIETAAEFNLDGPVGQVNAIAVVDVVDMLFAGAQHKLLVCPFLFLEAALPLMASCSILMP
ncbi:zinc finger CCCH domain-containing protein 63-like [Hevea brasiliensis]|uniref:zinc finger CCCH domain-containing protein 63-like n=1 Tax=Hevea brasiliensis TaxID=3981 RepID=UPI0025D72AE3|nr:zinc finger CCCH domain-containing protein 63-like [Hevea brasiliensis]